MFSAVYADDAGNAYVDERHTAVGRTGEFLVELTEEQLIPLPAGASFVLVPGRVAVGVSLLGNFSPLGPRKLALAALLPQGYTRLALPAYHGEGDTLPLFGYTALAWKAGQFYVAAKLEDIELHKWDPVNFSSPELVNLVAARKSACPDNPIIQQLAYCALEYGCFTAQNVFYGRWEGGVPVSNRCNAACVGCISEQEAECCPSPQSRIKYRPNLQQVLDVALPHLQAAEDGIISFGQGCEGEPLLEAKLIAETITAIRQQTPRGTINANTNAGYVEGVRLVSQAGIDSLRVSLNSAVPANYQAYYRAGSYGLEDVKHSISLARSHGVYIALNLLAFPGVTDREDELEALVELIRQTGVNMVQVRNLNIDPEQYLGLMRHSYGDLYGLNQLADIITQEVPGVLVGSFSHPVSR